MPFRRLILPVLLAAASPAAAQTWAPYSFAESGFIAQYPAKPEAAKGVYTTAGGQTVPAITYAAEQDGVR